MKRTIFFDLGNVLIFFDHKQMCQQVASLTGMDDRVVTQLMQHYGRLYERGLIDTVEMHKTVCQEAKKPVDLAALKQAVSHIFRPNPPVISLAMQLKRQGHPLFLLSNTNEAHFAQARAQFDFLKEFDGFVLSYELKTQKPEKEIFLKAMELAQCSPQESFYTDDILSYVESARALQIDAEQYTNPEQLNQHLSSRGFI